MTDLERHIVNLLLDNDCVIVPGFGGFMAHSLAASYDDKNRMFVPPSRTVGFNPLLTMNDSLLAQAYVNCYDISYPEALRRIEADVECLKQQIEADGEHTICGVGRIVKLEDGRYDFMPEMSGIAAPCLYGMEPFEAEILGQEETDAASEDAASDVTPQTQADVTPNATPATDSVFATVGSSAPAKQDEAKPERREIAVRIPLSVVKHIAAACIMLFVMLSVPSKLGDASTLAVRKGAVDASMLFDIFPKEVTNGKPEVLNPIAVSEASENKEPEMQTAGASENVASADGATYYSIVLASCITRKNAEAYVEKLHRMGYADACVHTHDGVTKVIYKRFKNHTEASSAMKILIAKGDFADCWITVVR